MLEKALELLTIFEKNGYEAYLVGGFVRDFVLGRKSVDVDICTNATPKDIKKIFEEVRLPFEQYGSVHFTYKKTDFEITTYRMDLEYNNRRSPSKIMYTDKLIIDLKRRDFVMNTLCMDSKGEIIDLLGATSDINNKIIRSVGDADKRLNEDTLRVLRAIRFATQLDFDIDDDLKKAILNNKKYLKDLSYYRKKQELNKIFSSPNCLKGIALIKDFGLEEYLDINLPNEIIKTSDPLGIWVQINPSEKYPFTSNEISYLKAVKRVLNDKVINDVELYREGNYVCYIAAQILNIDAVSIYDRYDNLSIKKSTDIKINGKEIIELLKLEDKSKVKKIFKDLEEKIILNKLSNTKEDINKYLIDTYYTNML